MSEAKGRSSRRAILRMGWGAVAAAEVASLPRQARAQSSGGHRALVCVYLVGGNDSNNMIVPLDGAEYDAYASARGKLALQRGSLLPIAARNGAAYGLHPALVEMRDLYTAGKMAVVANMGSIRDARSHASPELSYLPNGFFTPGWAARWARESGAAQSAYTFQHGVSMVTPGTSQASGGQYENQGLRLAMQSAGSGLRFPNTPFGREMADVAALIKVGASRGMSGQVLTATLGGFDTHVRQLDVQKKLFRELSQTLAAFHRNLDSMGMADQVTIFTDSDFNRSLSPNATGGTEHAWGGHQLVIGGAVRGGDVYGEFPSFRTAGDAWKPTLSRDQYGAELRGWADSQQLFTLSRGAQKVGLFA